MSNGDSVDTTDTHSRPVVCDAGPVIHLDELGCLDLLEDFSQVVLPAAVRREVERHRPAALRSSEISWSHTAPRGSTPPELLVVARIVPLHDGEVEALRIALVHPRALLLTDDTAARLAARSLGIPVHGTIGVLVRAIRRQQRSRDAVLKMLRELPHRSSLYVHPALRHHVIRAVEESGGR